MNAEADSILSTISRPRWPVPGDAHLVNVIGPERIPRPAVVQDRSER
ncbi:MULTISPECIES: hypothetical protein [unclassified Streptomyces]